MKLIYKLLIVSILASSGALNAQNNNSNSQASVVKLIKRESEKRVDVLIGGKLFTSYQWLDTVYKPILYPVLTSFGTPITRGFPIEPREAERRDHIHHAGNWFNYGNVNGYDFWGNGHEGKRSVNAGQIKHLGIQKLSGGAGEGVLVTKASWIDPNGKELLAENTEFHFIAQGSIRIIDRIITLKATGAAVSFKDTKEGSFGIRVARQLELPSKQDLILTDAKGNPTTVKKMENDIPTGNYRSSEGDQGEEVWGKRAKWMDLYGNMGDEKVSLVICDHPKNLSYPTYWHARGYGLFAANPFGVKDFTNKKEELNYSIPAGGTLKLRYRIIISSGTHLSDSDINLYAADFASKY